MKIKIIPSYKFVFVKNQSLNINKFVYSDYLDICRWIKINPNLSKKSFLKILKKTPNKSKGRNSKISKNELKFFKTHYTSAEKILFK